MEVSHKCIIKEAELCTLYDEKIILLTKHRYIKNSSLCTLSVTDKLWYNFWELINSHLQCIFHVRNNKNYDGTRSLELW